jgi:hypothetical protein
MTLRTLGTMLAAAALLAGCGSQTSSTAVGPGSAPDPNSPVDFTSLGLVSQTGGGGQVSPVASPLDTPADVRAFVAQFRAPAVATKIRHLLAAADRPSGTHVVGAVVAVGCDVPPGVDVTHGTDQVQIIPKEVASPLPECLAPVTTVAVVAVPQT